MTARQINMTYPTPSIKTSDELETLYSNGQLAPDLFEALLTTHNSAEEMYELSDESLPKSSKEWSCFETKCVNGLCECSSGPTSCISWADFPTCGNKMPLQNPEDDFFSQPQDLPNRMVTAIQRKRQKKGCKCKRSACQKRYCECYNKGDTCDEECSCIGCINTPLLQKLSRKDKK